MTRGHPSPHPVYLDAATGERMKHCPTCGEDRSIDKGEFATRANFGGLAVQYRCRCRSCDAARAREYRAALGEEYLERERVRRQRGRRWW